MSKTRRTAARRILPLKNKLVLYVDDSSESSQVRQLLDSAGISAEITDGPVEPPDKKPLLIYHGGFYKGLDEIRELLKLLEFWSNQSPLVHRSVFAK